MEDNAKYYFIADTHLGLNPASDSEVERKLMTFLNSLPPETRALFLLGDIFDFWVEYRHVVPRGYVRLLGKLAELCDRGVEVFFFRGNHDYWTFGYLEEEIGMKVVDQPYFTTIDGKKFCIAHGDGLGNVKFSYRFIKFLFRNKCCMKMLKVIHPWITFSFAHSWSISNRRKRKHAYVFRKESDPLYAFAEKMEREFKADYCIFGHLHTPVEESLPEGGKMFILGDWINNSEYLLFDRDGMQRVKVY